ncbi:hypothetical protein [Chitinilyticum piscinae]|uniref:Uncharacterized protein n=1 Tax=Chitinilyticum piscinae TaxID=2866724 RepID=A0A8J7FKJ8_9NEIS|nr:hypothetical protein [Chitinilyticum piscinae]MBE9609707.1 hypothetical protein [Chitinilyticum piscinae]
MYLTDPRQYPRVNPQNPVIRALMSYLTEKDADAAQAKRRQLAELIDELLLNHDHPALNAALTQTPSQDAWLALWQIVCDAVEGPVSSGSKALPFAIPLILVAGSKNEITLNEQLDADAVLAVLRDAGIIRADAVISLSGALVHPDTLAAINPAQLRQWRDSHDASQPLPDLPATALTFKNEGVFLRYLVGVARQDAGQPAAIRLGGQVGNWANVLAKLVGDALAQDGLTLFPIPRVPQGLLAAQDGARQTQLETRLQVATSNALRSIRSKGRTPVICIASHEPAEIRITFAAQEDSERWEGYVWPLAPGDRVEAIQHYAVELFRECQVNDIRLIDGVQPDKDVDELPYFITAHTAATTQQ